MICTSLPTDADWAALIAASPEVAITAANLAPLDVDFVAQQPLYNLTVAKYVRFASSVYMWQSCMCQTCQSQRTDHDEPQFVQIIHAHLQ